MRPTRGRDTVSTTREITMTISSIYAEMIEVSVLDAELWVSGRIMVTAHGGGETHTWALRDGQRCWIGDRIPVTVIDPDPEPVESTPLTPPPIDKRDR